MRSKYCSAATLVCGQLLMILLWQIWLLLLFHLLSLLRRDTIDARKWVLLFL